MTRYKPNKAHTKVLICKCPTLVNRLAFRCDKATLSCLHTLDTRTIVSTRIFFSYTQYINGVLRLRAIYDTR